jgi:2-polyprenyl-3-methyl-5-hydroxy-6-metoxy-1,4-benzoquinol methylase
MSADSWETHAGWWQQHFTDGADPEYEEQILPLADVHLAGATRLLDIGCGEGQLSRRMAARGTWTVGIDPTAAAASATRGPEPRRCRSRRPASTPS